MKIDDEEYARIYHRYYGRVWRSYRAQRISDEDAHDHTQDTFQRFFENRHQLRGDDPLPFLLTIARNILLNKIRGQNAGKRRGQKVEIDNPEIAELAAPEEPDYAERQLWMQRSNWLHAAMNELPQSQRECLGLWLGGYKLEEIAERLGITIDAVKSRLRDARRQLRARLGTDALPEVEE